MSAVISIQELGKQYSLLTSKPYHTLRESIRNTLSFRKRSAGNQAKFWALENVSFEVHEGDRLGIIGRNGAGKSTLLKILSRITPPTTGIVNVEGRMASLLEVGTGFHPELTGRENIYFNGSVLGLKKKEIDTRFDEIVDFSGVERFIDLPLKQFSSGMQLRLAFSVAAHLDPEILMIDEVLAVGDLEFQKKCLSKMNEVGTRDGRTILFVSHNLNYISALCNKAILLDAGKLVAHDNVNAVVGTYLSSINQSGSSKTWKGEERPGNGIVRLNSLKLTNHTGSESSSFRVNESVIVTMEYEVWKDDEVLWLGHNIFTASGINVFDTHSVNTELYNKPHAKGCYTASVTIPGNFLNTGTYLVSSAIFNHLSGNIHLHEKDVLLFSIHEVFDEETARGMSPGEFPGVVRPLLSWTINRQT